ncbi:MAG: hypothetical protein QNJ72_45750 [Pleurocapsa sp. MO_226.B13]|nr:hypothetical protein [Pleurocapsa sp. MO_226.B13]
MGLLVGTLDSLGKVYQRWNQMDKRAKNDWLPLEGADNYRLDPRRSH